MNDLADLMERTTADLHPDVVGLVAGGVARGRRRRLRRRVAAGSAAAVSVAAVGAAAFLAPAVLAGETSSPSVAAAPSAPKAAEKVASREMPTRAALANGSVVALPPGTESLIKAWGGGRWSFVAAAWRYAPASGGNAARVEILVEKVRMPVLSDVEVDPDALADLGNPTGELDKKAALEEVRARAARPDPNRQSDSAEAACRAGAAVCRELPDGTWLSTFTWNEPLSGGGASGIVSSHADLYTADGFHVSATAYNAMGEKHTPVTRATPVLNEEQLVALVRSADWD